MKQFFPRFLKSVRKDNFSVVILFAILILAIILRLQYLDYPLTNGEAQGNFLAGNHILKYGEFPLTGAPNALGAIRTSPAYYYLIAIILLINNNLIFLQAVNIMLQIITIFFVYYLGYYLFSRSTGLISAFLYSISVVTFDQSRFFWQPHAMVFFIHLAMVLLAKAYQSHEERFLYISVFFFFLGSTIHNSAYLLLPIYLFLTVYLFKNSPHKRKIYATTLLIGSISSLLLYLPSYIYMSFHHIGVSSIFERFLYFSTSEEINNFIINLFNNLRLFLNLFFIRKNEYPVLLVPLGIIFYTIYQKKESYWRRYLLIFFTIFLALLISSLFDKRIFTHYYMSIFGLFLIMLSETIVFISKQLQSRFLPKAISYFLLIIAVVVLANIFSRNYSIISPKRPLYNKNKIAEISNAILKEARAIQADENREQLNFFTISVYNQYKNHPMNAMPFWMDFEDRLNTRFIKLNKNSSNYYVTNTSDYIFFVCQNVPILVNINNCIKLAFNSYPHYKMIKEVFNTKEFKIYLFKNKPKEI